MRTVKMPTIGTVIFVLYNDVGDVVHDVSSNFELERPMSGDKHGSYIFDFAGLIEYKFLIQSSPDVPDTGGPDYIYIDTIAIVK